ncbi:MAG: DUF2812 domain-containing protein [Oscillospiraceae bacterium]
MDRARKVRKILPVSPCDIRGLEAWLEERANAGLFPVSIGSWAVFTTDGVPGTRFRLEPYDQGRTAPTEEQQELYRRAGWSYALNVAPAGCWLFYTADPAAVELYSDHESRGLSLERLERAARRAWQRSLLLGWSWLPYLCGCCCSGAAAWRPGAVCRWCGCGYLTRRFWCCCCVRGWHSAEAAGTRDCCAEPVRPCGWGWICRPPPNPAEGSCGRT